MSINNKVCMLTAPYYKTGGTELCHQLVYAINNMGGEASVLYKKAEDGNYLNPSFSKYINEYEILDDNFYKNFDGIVVIPESETLEIPKFKKATIYLWWMSVDYYYRYQNLKYVYEEKKLLRTIKFLFKGYKFKKKYLQLNKMPNVSLHLAQSEYAVDFLAKKGFTNVRYLSDFINKNYLMESDEKLKYPKENIVIYNPSKGLLFTKKIIKANKDINFLPLVNMTNKEIMECMSKAKLYIDFGAHPGKDRMPREAAVMGCCIITGKRGSASFGDIAIPEKYKFADKNSSIKRITNAINDILNNYNVRISDFENYREKIKIEEEKFYKDVKDIFLSK